MKIIEEAIDYLHEKNIIKREELSFVREEKDLILTLLDKNINQDIIKSIIDKFFSKKTYHNELIKDNIIYKTSYGFLISDDYYIPLDIYYSNNIFNKISNKYKSKLFKNIIIISNTDYLDIFKKYSIQNEKYKNENKNIIIYTIKEIIQNMINNKINKVLIDTRKTEIYYNYITFSKKVENNIFLNLKTDNIIKIIKNDITDENSFFKDIKNYKIRYNKISDSTIEISVYNYNLKSNILKKLSNFKEIKLEILKSSGLFIFSEKYNYGYFYEILDLLSVDLDKKILSIDENNRFNFATKNINLSGEVGINRDIINDFDILIIENLNLLNKDYFEIVNLFLANGKKVIFFMTSKDAINSLSNLIYNYPLLEKDIISEYINGIFHVTRVPVLCEHCKIKKHLIEIDNVRDQYKDILEKNDKKTEVYIRNHEGCPHCIDGYSTHYDIEQFVRKSQILSSGINSFNIQDLKEQLTSEGNYENIENKFIDLIIKQKITSIYDLKTKL